MEAELIFRQEGLQRPSLRAALFDADFHMRGAPEGDLLRKIREAADKWLYMIVVRARCWTARRAFDTPRCRRSTRP